MYIEYQEKIVSEDENIQKLANILSKLEIKAINKLVDDMELPKVLEKYLSAKERNIYYKSKFKLKELLNKWKKKNDRKRN